MNASREEDKPPSPKISVDTCPGSFLALGAFIGRLKNIGELWRSDWSIPPIRSNLCSRRILILADIQKVKQ